MTISISKQIPKSLPHK